MRDNKLIAGKEYYVSSKSKEKALYNKVKLEFACYDRSKIMYFHSCESLCPFKYAVEIPEPTIEPWTKDTFPLDALVWVRRKGLNTLYLISNVDNYNVFSINGVDYSNDFLLDEYERVMPDRTIAPCGVAK